jgi:TetR/AcrR family transcriptional regulator of autoinduction and epiphytic fitness
LWKLPASPVTSRRDRRREARIQALLRTTAEVVAERGYHRASLEEIADRLNLGKPALYHYYRGKEDLVLTCLSTCHEHIIRLLSGVATDRRLNARDRLRTMIVLQLETVCIDHPELSHLFLHPIDWPESIESEVRVWRKQHDRVFRAVIESGIKRAELNPHDPHVARMCLYGALNHAPLWLRGKSKRGSIELVADTVMDLFVQGDRGNIR